MVTKLLDAMDKLNLSIKEVGDTFGGKLFSAVSRRNTRGKKLYILQEQHRSVMINVYAGATTVITDYTTVQSSLLDDNCNRYYSEQTLDYIFGCFFCRFNMENGTLIPMYYKDNVVKTKEEGSRTFFINGGASLSLEKNTGCFLYLPDLDKMYYGDFGGSTIQRLSIKWEECDENANVDLDVVDTMDSFQF